MNGTIEFMDENDNLIGTVNIINGKPMLIGDGKTIADMVSLIPKKVHG